MSGPHFRYSESCELVINTGTSIVTFLMVCLIQNTQNRDATAVQVNLGTISLERGRGDEKLAGCAAIIAVPTMIAGIYGINFKDMPEFELK